MINPPLLNPWLQFCQSYALVGLLLATLVSLLHWAIPYLANRPADGASAALARRVHRVQAFAAGFGWLEYPLVAFGTIVQGSLVLTKLQPETLISTGLALYAALWCLQVLMWIKRPIRGRVVTPRQAPVPLAVVRAVPVNTNRVYATVTTNHAGWFTIPAHPGSYVLRVDKDGFGSTSATETVDQRHGARVMLSLTPPTPEPTLTNPNPVAPARPATPDAVDSFWNESTARQPAALVDRQQPAADRVI